MVRKRLPRPIALWSVALLATAACDSDPIDPPDDPPVTASVSVIDNAFTPGTNAIDAGETVTWLWTGNNPHNVTFDDAALGDSQTQQAGSFQRTFDTPGDYTYYCTVHGRTLMSGTVMVRQASAGAGSGPASGYP